MPAGSAAQRVAVIGAGPGGLYFAALAKKLAPHREITVWERDARDDAFGFGVVFSDETLDGIAQADPPVFAALSAEFARWSDIDVRYAGQVRTCGGHGFAALDRNRLRAVLQQRCAELGVDVRYRTPAPPVARLAAGYDLVVAADGVRSASRAALAEAFRPELDERHCRYIWLATDKVFEAFTFIVEQYDFGALQVHAYPYSDRRSTFIVEMAEEAWRKAGFEEPAGREPGRGQSDLPSVRRCEQLLAPHLDGHRLIPNASRWIRFTTVRNASWHHRNVVLLGDAAHTAHFSIGSGTKLALEDALALAAALQETPTLEGALAAYETERRPVVESAQRAAQASLEWFETVGRHTGQGAEQFAFNLLTRSRRVTYGNLRARDAAFVDAVDAAYGGAAEDEGGGDAGGEPAGRGSTSGDVTSGDATAARTAPGGTAPGGGGGRAGVPPMFRPLRLGRLWLRNRIVVPPLATFTAVDGLPSGFDRAQLAAQVLGGAGLVFTGMTAVSAQGRATERCPGLWTDAQEAAWRSVVRAVRELGDTPLGIQLTHAGRRASSTVPGPDGIGRPLADGWPTLAASPLPWEAAGPPPRPAGPAELAGVAADFAAAAARADRAGFDVLGLQFGHGHLVSGFLSPLTNQRTDRYGGPLEHRLRLALEVLAAVRAVWPAGKPVVVRVSAADWAPGGTTEAEAVAICRALADAGADALDVSTGEVVAHQEVPYGRGYQVPFADLIRHATGIPTIAVGAISGHDDANSVLLAGRADLVAVGRAQLYDPLWTLHAAAEQGYTGPGARWPQPWQPGSRRPPGPGADRVAPRLRLLPEAAAPVHRRWLPPHRPDAGPPDAGPPDTGRPDGPPGLPPHRPDERDGHKPTEAVPNWPN
ncbi:FAD-dependent monooxygenase [Streptomyces sp. CB01881]|uniref:oxidoreductase n=1 Tax=Streptomyces sp. CB01881 TaxID=2078691 RepID=UPI000CDBE29F|nr:FAD-dependent monooxygenase [Streptomyces sp. CB01881]AUY52665.1 bifunctional salicylyl-CoA 5-hydroxylase/oxidoreductase [Streptomyces sp. CB01881]TYC70383.1 bifunctional salicylyl-CoA 5-hydroxylase/oxidoreductase [Streptomyces sp. CB01881]